MRKLLGYFLCMMLLVFGMGTGALATMYTGNISSSAGGGMYATAQWDAGGAALSWNVDDVTNLGFWTYSYTWSGATKALSHISIEVSDNFTGQNIISTTGTGIRPTAPDTYNATSQGNSNPGIPGDLFGIKWDTTGDPTVYMFSIVSDRAPMWGDFYAKDGVYNPKGGPKVDVYAYNTGFGFDTTLAIGNGNAGGWLLVPDTQTSVPEPATMLLLGSGLIGLAVISRKRFMK